MVLIIDKQVCNSVSYDEFFSLMCRVIFFKKIVVLWKETYI
jgi:hypothetical protein